MAARRTGQPGPLEVLHRGKGVTGVFGAARVARVHLLPARDVDAFLQLVVIRAQLHRAAEAAKDHAAEPGGHAGGLGRLHVGHGVRQHLDAVIGGVHRQVFPVALAKGRGQFADRALLVGVVGGHLVDRQAPTALGQRGGRAHEPGVVGVEGDVQALPLQRLDHVAQVGTPVAGDQRLRARVADALHEGREIDALERWVQLVAHHLHVRALLRHGLAEVARDLLAVGVVLVQQKDLLQRGLQGHEPREGLHLHAGVGVDAEVPVAALLGGQRRVHGGVVDVEHGVLRVARVVPRHRVRNGRRRARAVALHDVAKALVDGGLERVEAFLRRALVVKAGHHETHTGRVGRAVPALGHELPALEAVAPDVARRPRERVDEGDAHGLALLGPQRQRPHQRGHQSNAAQGVFHFST